MHPTGKTGKSYIFVPRSRGAQMVMRGWDDNLLSSENGSDVLFVLIVLYELGK